LQYLEQAKAIDKRNLGLFFQYVGYYRAISQHDAAFELMQGYEPNIPKAKQKTFHLLFADVCLHLNKNQLAQKSYEKLIKMEPFNSSIMLEYAMSFYENDKQRCLDILSRVIQIAIKSGNQEKIAEAWKYRANFYYSCFQYKKALEDLNKIEDLGNTQISLSIQSLKATLQTLVEKTSEQTVPDQVVENTIK
jgi:tetratricopeptide (TPR) repeat protein